MKTAQLLFVILFTIHFTFASEKDWGSTGHRATGEIAQEYLTKKAKRNIKKLLNGHSLAFVSTYGDDIKSDRKYNKYNPWHYVNFPFGTRYENSDKNEKGDIITAIHTCIDILKSESTSTAEKAFHLKLLIHFMGDLHQPLHIGLADDRGGNDFQVRWFNEGTNLHSVWDSKMIDYYNMSYTELAENKDCLSDTEIEQIKKGSLMDWVYESRTLCENIYANTTIGEELGYQYVYKYIDIVRMQLEKGGIRLAVVLNEIFG